MTRKAELIHLRSVLEAKLKFYSVDPDTFARKIEDIEAELSEVREEMADNA